MRTQKRESRFQTAFLKRLRKIPGSWWMKCNDKTTIGLPDIIGFCNGLGFAFELKTKSKIDALQLDTLRKIAKCATVSAVITEDNCKEMLSSLAFFAITEHKRSLIDMQLLGRSSLDNSQASTLRKRRSCKTKKRHASLLSNSKRTLRERAGTR